MLTAAITFQCFEFYYDSGGTCCSVFFFIAILLYKKSSRNRTTLKLMKHTTVEKTHQIFTANYIGNSSNPVRAIYNANYSARNENSFSPTYLGGWQKKASARGEHSFYQMKWKSADASRASFTSKYRREQRQPLASFFFRRICKSKTHRNTSDAVTNNGLE